MLLQSNLHCSRQITLCLTNVVTIWTILNLNFLFAPSRMFVHHGLLIVGDKYLNRLQQQATVFKIDDKKLVPGRSQSFIGKDQVMLSSRNATIPRMRLFQAMVTLRMLNSKGLQPRCP
jgi:hypothetical protein